MANDKAVASRAADDLYQNSYLPSVIPKGHKETKFLTPALPVGSPFGLAIVGDIDDEWLDEAPSGTLLGLFSPDEFVTNPETNIASAHTASGEPVVIRCIEQRGTQLICVGDEGESVVYEVQPLHDNELEIGELS